MFQRPFLRSSARLLGALAASTAIALPALADEPFDDSQEAALQELVREYIMANPEIIADALVAYEDQRLAAEAAAQKAAVEAAWDDLLSNANDFAIGPRDAPVQMVQFFDYNCGFCKQAATWTQDLIETHGADVRVVFKEAPIFAGRLEGSGEGAKAALAAKDQGKYLDVHFALMSHDGTLEAPDVTRIARSVGANANKLEKGMENEAFTTHLAENLFTMETLGLGGTPAFIINGEVVYGFDVATLDRLVGEALAEG